MGKDEKICPLSYQITDGFEEYTFCKKEKCTWWVKDYRMCIVLYVGMVLGDNYMRYYAEEKDEQD